MPDKKTNAIDGAIPEKSEAAEPPVMVTLSIDVPVEIAKLLAVEANSMGLSADTLVSLWVIKNVRKY